MRYDTEAMMWNGFAGQYEPINVYPTTCKDCECDEDGEEIQIKL